MRGVSLHTVVSRITPSGSLRYSNGLLRIFYPSESNVLKRQSNRQRIPSSRTQPNVPKGKRSPTKSHTDPMKQLQHD
eukprot:7244883-Pyramimonas_sp.AAC.2